MQKPFSAGSLQASLCCQYRPPGKCRTCGPLQRPLTVPPPSQGRARIVDGLRVDEEEPAPHAPWSPPSSQSQRGGRRGQNWQKTGHRKGPCSPGPSLAGRHASLSIPHLHDQDDCAPPPRSSCSALGPEIFFYKVDWVGATRRSSPDEWIHKMQSIRTVEYYSAMKRKEVLRQG